MIALVAILVLGPDKLPDLARQAAQLLHKARAMATSARDDLRTRARSRVRRAAAARPRPPHDRAQAHHRGDGRGRSGERRQAGHPARRPDCLPTTSRPPDRADDSGVPALHGDDPLERHEHPAVRRRPALEEVGARPARRTPRGASRRPGAAGSESPHPPVGAAPRRARAGAAATRPPRGPNAPTLRGRPTHGAGERSSPGPRRRPGTTTPPPGRAGPPRRPRPGSSRATGASSEAISRLARVTAAYSLRARSASSASRSASHSAAAWPSRSSNIANSSVSQPMARA